MRGELHDFGFRPNLDRRPRDARVPVVDGRETDLVPAESVAWDIHKALEKADGQ